jgi:DNA-binding GntR family transcriptional regulator
LEPERGDRAAERSGVPIGANWRHDGVNLGGAVYAELCDRLVKGRFQPNDRLRIRELAEVLGTSVTPVRDAVLRLVQDRALVMRSQRDIRVPILTEEEYVEIRTIRMSLEGLAVEKAADRADDGLIADLKELAALNASALARGDSAAATELNQRFHFRLADGARMPVLRRILERLWLQMGPLIADMNRDVDQAAAKHHYVLVDALERGDGTAAAEAVRQDITDGGQAILPRIRALHTPEAGGDAKRRRRRAGDSGGP